MESEVCSLLLVDLGGGIKVLGVLVLEVVLRCEGAGVTYINSGVLDSCLM